MSNSYFQFKQFRIEQSRCAMKVSTDACIQGAWTPVENDIKNVLDIGAGTGLLSLMLAQRSIDCFIDAIELDENAARQANENFQHSPWTERLHCIHGDAKTVVFDKKYDLIISNPPFFKNSLLGDDVKRNQARHSLSFSLEDLMSVIDANLSEHGYCSVLLPVVEQQHWRNLLFENDYTIFLELNIHPSKGKAANRIVTVSSKSASSTHQEDLFIRNEGNNYSSSFEKLMQPFYLNL